MEKAQRLAEAKNLTDTLVTAIDEIAFKRIKDKKQEKHF